MLDRQQRAALVGDGSTDLEAAAAGVYVIGFGGVVSRANVAAQAHAFVAGPGMLCVLEALLSVDERAAIREA